MSNANLTGECQLCRAGRRRLFWRRWELSALVCVHCIREDGKPSNPPQLTEAVVTSFAWGILIGAVLTVAIFLLLMRLGYGT